MSNAGTFESLFYIGHTPRACFGIKQFTCGLRADDDSCASFSMLGRCREEATSYTCSYYVRLRVCRPTVLAIRLVAPRDRALQGRTTRDDDILSIS